MGEPVTMVAHEAPSFSEPGILAKARHENFPVASRLLPRAQRDHLLAIYGFARLVDDIGDESTGDRMAELDWAEHQLDLAFRAGATSPIFVNLQRTLAAVELPRTPFADLIEANRRDQVVATYATFADLLGYCALSADPVGRLVLGVFGVADPERITLSDKICSGLQLVEHWQDVKEDALRRRVYIPSEDLERYGVRREELTGAVPSAAFRRLLAFEVGRARELLESGQALVGTLHGRARLAIAGFVSGGHAALDAIEKAGYDVLGHSPGPRPVAALARAARLLAGRRR